MTSALALRTERLSPSVREEWDDFVGRSPEAGFMQSWAWGEFKRSCGQEVVRLGVFDEDNSLCGGAAVYYVRSSLGASPLEVPHGPVFCSEPALAGQAAGELMAELRCLAGEVRSPAVRIEPFREELPPGMREGFVRAPLDLVPTPTRLVAVGRSDEELLAAMESKGRYNVRLALKKGVEAGCHSGTEALRDFYSLFELTSLRHGFSGESLAFFDQMLQCLGGRSPQARIYLAHYKGMLAAAAVVVFFGRRATYLYGGSSPFLGPVMAPYALHWRIMQDARAAGCAEYDLYGVAPEGMPFHPYARFSQFKARFGGRVFVPAGAHDLYLYSQIAGMWVDNLLARGDRAVMATG